MLAKASPWQGRKYFLDKMSLSDLVVAYFTHYSIQVYLLLAAMALVLGVRLAPSWREPTLAIAAVIVLYPLVEYALHRWVLHSRLLYKRAWTARAWKRIHYDHHQDPNHLEVLFGALHTTLPAVAAVTLPIGYLIGGVGGAAIVLDARSVEPDLATPDAALVWDIRVHPAFRRQGVGRALLAFAESHARAAGRARMIIETQDINVAACRQQPRPHVPGGRGLLVDFTRVRQERRRGALQRLDQGIARVDWNATLRPIQ